MVEQDQRKQYVHKHQRKQKETQLSAQLTFIRFQIRAKNLVSVMGKLRKNKRQALSSRNFQSNREGDRKMAGKLGVHAGPSIWYTGRGLRAGLLEKGISELGLRLEVISQELLVAQTNVLCRLCFLA